MEREKSNRDAHNGHSTKMRTHDFVIHISHFNEQLTLTFNETKIGSASVPSNHSSAVFGGSSDSVSGYKSSWKSSERRGTVNEINWHNPLLVSR